MAELRECYWTWMRFFRDRPDVWTKVVYFFVDDTRPTLTNPTPFYSRVWDKGELPELLGEDLTTYNRSDGLAPADFRGTHFCGSADQWLNGCNYADVLPPATNGNPLTCCPDAGPLAWPVGKAKLGGYALSFSGVELGGGLGGGDVQSSSDTEDITYGEALGGGDVEVSQGWTVEVDGEALGGGDVEVSQGWTVEVDGEALGGGDVVSDATYHLVVGQALVGGETISYGPLNAFQIGEALGGGDVTQYGSPGAINQGEALGGGDVTSSHS